MYARDLMFWLHERLSERNELGRTQERFERLRGYGLLPQMRENAGVRLSDEQIARAVLGFAHPLPGFAGHASLILGNLRPVGGPEASFRCQPTLLGAVANLIESPENSSDLLRITLSVERDFHEDDYTALLYIRDDGSARAVSFVSKYASSLFGLGKEQSYDHERLSKKSAVQLSLGADFFRELSDAVSISRHLDRPLKTDWTEYTTEEEKAELHARLGARRSSRFLNLRVDAQVTWPKEPTRVKFGGHHLVLFPKTKDNSHSISIDLFHEGISQEDARSLMNRMLSVMSWCEDRPASLHEGWSGNPVPTPVSNKNLGFVTTHEWHFYRTPPNDDELRRSLAFYRDGLNALSVGLASHAVLSFYRVIEAKFKNEEKPKATIISWIDEAFGEIQSGIPESTFTAYDSDRKAKDVSHGRYIFTWGRIATAHAANDAPSDPDGAEEHQRLFNAARIIQRLARHLIKQDYNYSDSYFSDVAK